MVEEKIVIRKGKFGSWVTGILFGTLVGGTVALLMAPQSGMQTRAVLAQRGNEIRDRTKDMVGDARSRVVEIAEDTRGRVDRMISTARGTPVERALDQEVRDLDREVDIMESEVRRTDDL